MKKYFIRITLVLILGLAMLIVGLANNGMKTLIIANGKTEIFKKRNITREYPIEEFKNIKLNISDNISTNVEFVYGNKYSVKLVGKSIPSVDDFDISVKKSGDTLNVSDNTSGSSYNTIGFNFDYNLTENEKKIIITIPENKKIDNASMNLGYGRLIVNNNIFKKVDITGSPTISLTDVNLEDGSYINTDNGAIDIRNSVIKGAIKANDADLSITNSQVKNTKLDSIDSQLTLNNVKLDNTSVVTEDEDINAHQLEAINKNSIIIKNADIEITNSNDYGLNIINSDGEINVNGKNYQDDYKKASDDKNLLNITSTNGDVDVN